MKFLHLIFLYQVAICSLAQDNATGYLAQITQTKKTLKSCPDSLFSETLNEELIDHVFPHWYGTKWDYNGYTNTPKEGEIACGYFVSTTLKHVGFNLNRYDIAKMYSSDIVKVLCQEDYEILYDFEKFKSRIIRLEKGLYILGLSNHVGFLSMEKDGAYFIHSDYSSEYGARKEFIASSFALQNSTSFWIGNFSNHPNTSKWYKEEREYLKVEK